MYNPNSSEYFAEFGGRNESKTYGSFIHIEGRTVQDQICLKKQDVCIEPFNFFLVTDQYGIPEETDGILGLAQGEIPRGFNMPKYFNVGELYVDYLRLLGHINEKAFSTHFTGQDGESFVDFGPPREAEMSDVRELVEIPVKRGFFYTSTP